jgi:hydrogenase nickel incorporation protein HypA/HybF
MHEFSLAKNIIEIVEEAIQKNNATIVIRIELEIGKLSGVEIPALETALDCLRAGSIVNNATIVLNAVEAIAVCRTCHQEYKPVDLYTPCPGCDSFGPEIISGKELIVKSIIAE